jgi:ferredoxin-thioredoxin reductase catalytic subunit
MMPSEAINIEAEKARIMARLEKYAQHASLRLNPDKQRVDEVIQGLIARKQEYGCAYCPCRVVTGNKDEDKKAICPCAYHKQEIAEKGMCLCGLFLKNDPGLVGV